MTPIRQFLVVPAVFLPANHRSGRHFRELVAHWHLRAAGPVMRLTPREPKIPEVGGFTDDNDLFDLSDFAERLSNLIHKFDEPLVIALDGPWGSNYNRVLGS